MASAPSLLMFTDAYRCLPSAFGTALTQPSICGGHVFQDFFVVILIAVQNTPPQKKTSCICIKQFGAIVWGSARTPRYCSKPWSLQVDPQPDPQDQECLAVCSIGRHTSRILSPAVSKWNSVGVQNHWFTSVER